MGFAVKAAGSRYKIRGIGAVQSARQREKGASYAANPILVYLAVRCILQCSSLRRNRSKIV